MQQTEDKPTTTDYEPSPEIPVSKEKEKSKSGGDDSAFFFEKESVTSQKDNFEEEPHSDFFGVRGYSKKRSLSNGD